MPEITALGWFHTAMGVVALVCGVYTLIRYAEILPRKRSGQVYLGATLITAATALMIFQHGGFGVAHGLAVLTLGALFTGMIAATTRLFGRFSRYVQALSFTATLLFHGVPAVTDALLRLPVGDPVVSSLDDPVMRAAHLALLVLFLIGITVQLLWIARQPAAAADQ